MVTSLSLKTLPHSSVLGRCLLGNGFVTCSLPVCRSQDFWSPCSKVDEPSFVSISRVCRRGNHMRWHKSIAQFLVRLSLWWYLKCTSYFLLIRNWCLLILAAFARKTNKQYYFNWYGSSHHGTWSTSLCFPLTCLIIPPSMKLTGENSYPLPCWCNTDDIKGPFWQLPRHWNLNESYL